MLQSKTKVPSVDNVCSFFPSRSFILYDIDKVSLEAVLLIIAQLFMIILLIGPTVSNRKLTAKLDQVELTGVDYKL